MNLTDLTKTAQCKDCAGVLKVLPEGWVEYDEFDPQTWDDCPRCQDHPGIDQQCNGTGTLSKRDEPISPTGKIYEHCPGLHTQIRTEREPCGYDCEPGHLPPKILFADPDRILDWQIDMTKPTRRWERGIFVPLPDGWTTT